MHYMAFNPRKNLEKEIKMIRAQSQDPASCSKSDQTNPGLTQTLI